MIQCQFRVFQEKWRTRYVLLRVTRSLAAWLVVGLVALLLGPSASLYAQTDKNEFTKGGVLVATNGIYDVIVQDLPGSGVGLYTIRTGSAHPVPHRNLLFGAEATAPGTSYTTIRSYTTGTDYVQVNFSPTSSFRVVRLDPFAVVAPEGSTGFIITYVLPGPPTTPDALEIKQILKVNGTGFAGSTVEVTTIVKNLGTNPVAIGVRHLWDFQIGQDDGPTFRQINPTGAALTTETAFSPANFDSYLVVDNDFADPTSPLYSEFGTVAGPAALVPFPTKPDLLQYVAWPRSFFTAFDYAVTPGLDIATLAAPFRGFAGGDVAVNYFFGPTASGAITIAPGTLRIFTASLFAAPPIINPIDTDGDGLLDDWEIRGFDADGDGIIDVDLPRMGANPLRKDIFVEADWMEDSNHSHKPSPEAINAVIQAFASAPVSNPDGSTGITLHVDTGQLGGGNSLPHDNELGCKGFLGICLGFGNYQWSEFDQIKSANFSNARRQIFHYVVFAHNLGDLGGTSGISRGAPGSDFIVSLGSWPSQSGAPIGTPQQQAGTFMHELGHNLSLRHGGQDDINRKPNYLSVMNYQFQTDGLISNSHQGKLDYSRFDANIIPDLNENSLDERTGLNGGNTIAGYGTSYHCSGVGELVLDANAPINWNCNLAADGTPIIESNIAAEITDCNCGDSTDTNTRDRLRSFDDWSGLLYTGGSLGILGIGVQPPLESEAQELTTDADQSTPKLIQIDIRPDSSTNPINCKEPTAVVPVAILTTRALPGEGIDFDAATVDPLSVRFGPGEATEIHRQGHLEDVDGDGDLDLVLHFRVGEARIACGTSHASLEGRTRTGKVFMGSDHVITVP